MSPHLARMCLNFALLIFGAVGSLAAAEKTIDERLEQPFVRNVRDEELLSALESIFAKAGVEWSVDGEVVREVVDAVPASHVALGEPSCRQVLSGVLSVYDLGFIVCDDHVRVTTEDIAQRAGKPAARGVRPERLDDRQLHEVLEPGQYIWLRKNDRQGMPPDYDVNIVSAAEASQMKLVRATRHAHQQAVSRYIKRHEVKDKGGFPASHLVSRQYPCYVPLQSNHGLVMEVGKNFIGLRGEREDQYFRSDSIARIVRPSSGRENSIMADLHVRIIESALSSFAMDVGSFPTEEEGLGVLVKMPMNDIIERRWRGPYLEEIPASPWGKPYQYELEDGKPHVRYVGPETR